MNTKKLKNFFPNTTNGDHFHHKNTRKHTRLRKRRKKKRFRSNISLFPAINFAYYPVKWEWCETTRKESVKHDKRPRLGWLASMKFHVLFVRLRAHFASTTLSSNDLYACSTDPSNICRNCSCSKYQ